LRKFITVAREAGSLLSAGSPSQSPTVVATAVAAAGHARLAVVKRITRIAIAVVWVAAVTVAANALRSIDLCQRMTAELSEALAASADQCALVVQQGSSSSH
jgi:hypothetical protein